MKVQLTRDKSRLQNQLECLLEEMRIKLSSVISDLLGVSGCRILRPLAGGETDPKKLAGLGDDRLQCTEEQPTAHPPATACPLLDRHQTITEQIEKLDRMIAQAMKPPQEAVAPLAVVPGFGADGAHQVIVEVGPTAGTFPSAANLTAWVGTCPGRDESAEENHSSRSAKGNKYLRRILNQTQTLTFCHALRTQYGSTG
jgi:transposase